MTVLRANKKGPLSDPRGSKERGRKQPTNIRETLGNLGMCKLYLPTLHSEWRTVHVLRCLHLHLSFETRPAGKLVHTSKKSQVSLLTRGPGNLGQRQAFGEHRRIRTGTWLRSSFGGWIPKAPETVISGSLATSSARIQHQKVPT